MDLINNYIEMMGDMEFAIYAATFVFCLIFLIGLVAKLFERTPASVPPVVAKKPDSKAVEVKQETKPEIPVKVDKAPTPAPAPATVAAVPPAASPPTEGVMMWEFDDGKKKKSKKEPPSTKTTAAPPSPPAPVVAPPAPTVKEKEGAPGDQTRPEDKTVILPPKESKGTSPAPPPPSAPPVAAAPTAPTDNTSAEKSFVDFQMYETLVRRISGLEADLKRDPLYLDPLMKRIGNYEKRLEELVSKGADGMDSELKDLKEKVTKLQKLLEQLSEGPSAEASPKTSNYP